MELAQLFLLQHGVARDWMQRLGLAGLTDQQLRTRPQPGLNSVAWILWHQTRTEDFFVNRVVGNRPQVFEEQGWAVRLGVSLRRIGTFMSDDEVAGFSEQMDIAGLRAYWDAVGRQTEVVASTLPPEVWDQPLDAAALRKSFLEDGVFGDDAVREVELLLPHYLTRPVGGTLSHGALAHPLLHVGEASMIRALLGVRGM
jgi:hypothetical protein